ncbi:MAG TPA: hypothetical protein VKA00_00940 [Trueperaceae bacterium]|nr:hypothetical protein [Trueperaceae bacterium]
MKPPAADRAAGRLVRALRPLALAAVPLFSGATLAYTPSDILAATPASERTLRQAAAVTSTASALASDSAGTDATLRMAPELSYGADVEDPATLAPALDLSLELGWRYDRAAVLSDHADLIYAQERLRHWRRVDALDALRLLSRSLRAELAVQRAQLDLARAHDAADAPAARRAQAVLTARRHTLEALRADAAALGFDGEARLEPTAFVLPPAPAVSPQHERLALSVAAARQQRRADTTFAMLRDVSLDATYESRTDRYQVTGRLSLDRGRPGASLAAEVGSQEDDQWSLRLSADVRIDGAMAEARARADERVRRAEAELAAADGEYARQLDEARTAVEDARAMLDAELASWRAEAERAGRSGAATGPSVSACRSLLARENAVYGAWSDVVSATFDYLEAVDGVWAVAAFPAATQEGSPGGAGRWPSRPSACAGPA